MHTGLKALMVAWALVGAWSLTKTTTSPQSSEYATAIAQILSATHPDGAVFRFHSWGILWELVIWSQQNTGGVPSVHLNIPPSISIWDKNGDGFIDNGSHLPWPNGSEIIIVWSDDKDAHRSMAAQLLNAALRANLWN